jgi:hypothetical protein
VLLFSNSCGICFAADLSTSLILIEAAHAGKPGRNQNGNLSIACTPIRTKL